LVLVPAFFSIAIDVETWIGRQFGKLIHASGHKDGEAEPLPAE
jgi:hypothetical protein